MLKTTRFTGRYTVIAAEKAFVEMRNKNSLPFF